MRARLVALASITLASASPFIFLPLADYVSATHINFRFLARYQISQVMMKVGRMSKPGTSSNNDTIPIKRNIAKQATIPIMSRKSPTMGRSRIANMYSLMSSIMQTTRVSNSYSVKTKYRKKSFWSRRFKGVPT